MMNWPEGTPNVNDGRSLRPSLPSLWISGSATLEIAHYFGVDQEKVLALRSYYGLSMPEKVPAIEASSPPRTSLT